MDYRDYFHLGSIIKCNRKTAELSIRADAGEPSQIEDAPWLFIELQGGLVPFAVESVRPKTADVYLVLLEDYHDPEIAQRFVDCRVFLKNNDAREDEERIYYEDIIGFEVIDKTYGKLGKIEDIIQAPEQDLIMISYREKEVLIPLVEAFLLSLDLQKKEIYFDLPEGLIELYLDE
ncbi:MAG: ribosome maturation factor RimM [Bacteroidales bacterium]